MRGGFQSIFASSCRVKDCFKDQLTAGFCGEETTMKFLWGVAAGTILMFTAVGATLGAQTVEKPKHKLWPRQECKQRRCRRRASMPW